MEQQGCVSLVHSRMKGGLCGWGRVRRVVGDEGDLGVYCVCDGSHWAGVTQQAYIGPEIAVI